MQLEEKRVPYKVEKINLSCYGDRTRSFLDKARRGELPAIEIDGKINSGNVNSVELCKLLEMVFPQRPLLPPQGSDSDLFCQQQFLAHGFSICGRVTPQATKYTFFRTWTLLRKNSQGIRKVHSFLAKILVSLW
jgi:glutathione S-transferase